MALYLLFPYVQFPYVVVDSLSGISFHFQPSHSIVKIYCFFGPNNLGNSLVFSVPNHLFVLYFETARIRRTNEWIFACLASQLFGIHFQPLSLSETYTLRHHAETFLFLTNVTIWVVHVGNPNWGISPLVHNWLREMGRMLFLQPLWLLKLVCSSPILCTRTVSLL